MAQRMSAASPPSGSPPSRPVSPWEKSGNTSWVQCGQCDGWFHVSDAMLDDPAMRMHCPACHHEFTAGDAKRVARAR